MRILSLSFSCCTLSSLVSQGATFVWPLIVLCVVILIYHQEQYLRVMSCLTLYLWVICSEVHNPQMFQCFMFYPYSFLFCLTV